MQKTTIMGCTVKEILIDDYSYFLNGFNPDTDGRTKLALEDVKKSGLSPETLEKASIRLFNGDSDLLKKRLGFAALNGNNILSVAVLMEIPFFDAQGNVVKYEYRLYPETDDRKYLHPLHSSPVPYISKDVWAIRDKVNKPLWITEGAKKVLKLIQHRKAAIGLSGVYGFRAGKQDAESLLCKDLQSFLWKGRTVYLAFDNDLWTNPQVRYALYELAFKLCAQGAIVKIATWTGEKGIDDHLAASEDPGKALDTIEEKALSVDKFATSDHLSEIVRGLALSGLEGLQREAMVNSLAKRFNVRPKSLYLEIAQKTSKEKDPFTEEEKAVARELLKSPDLIKQFLNVCHIRYVGRDKTLILVKLSTVTRNLNKGLPLVLSGPSSVGKSALIEVVLKTVDPKAVENFTRTSAQYLLYRDEDLAHKIVTYYELQGVGKTAEIIRSALSEGELVLGTVMKDASGSLKSAKIEKDTRGLVILSTHTGYKLDHELSTRVLSQEITHDEAMARMVYNMKATDTEAPENDPFKIWRVADSLIEPREIEIPYIQTFAGLFPTNQERFMRDFDKVISLIKASALLHQYQREQTPDGKILANEADYELVYSLADTFTQSVLSVSEPVLNFLAAAQNSPGITKEELSEELHVSARSLDRYIGQASKAGYIEIEGRGKTAKITVVEIPQRQSVLPAPELVFEVVQNISNRYAICANDAPLPAITQNTNGAQETVDSGCYSHCAIKANDSTTIGKKEKILEDVFVLEAEELPNIEGVSKCN